MKACIGKYGAQRRKSVAAAKASNDFTKSLPLDIRKAMKERDTALGTLNGMIPRDGSAIDHDAFNTQRHIYDDLRLRVSAMIEEYRNA